MAERTLRVLDIAPDCGGRAVTPIGAEVGGLAQVPGAALEVVAGPEVTAARAAQALARRWDVVIWSGHGQANGLVVCRPEGGAGLVRARWVAAQVRAAAPKVLVLAACGSECADPESGESLVSAVSRVGVNVVGFPAQVPDGGGLTYAVEFVRALASGASVGDAHEVAREVVADGWPELAAGIRLTPGLTDGWGAFLERLERLEAGQARLEARLEAVARRLGA